VSAPPPQRRPAPEVDVPTPGAGGRVAIRGVAAGGAVALVAWAASGAFAHDRPAQLGAMAAAGEIRLASPDDGTAVLTASHMVPGDAVSGTVTLANTGDADGDLQLDRTAVVDSLGAGGGRLSGALRVEVDDVTGGMPQPVFDGALDQFDDLTFGRLAAGEQRTYRLTARLPDRGLPPGPMAGDNALQGATTQVDWTWHAEPMPGPAATPTPTPSPAVTPAPTTAPRPITTPLDSAAAASVLTLRIPWQRVMRTHGITVWGTCDRLCRLTFSARVQTAPRHGGHRRTLLARRVFRVAGTRRTLQPGLERRIKLRLTPRAVRRLRSILLKRGRAAVLVRARVRSALGAATVRRRIVIVTKRRATHHRVAQRKRR
jgi:hypothetical protein